jgi:hypothetical protein
VISISSTENPIVSKKTGRPIVRIDLVSSDDDATLLPSKKPRFAYPKPANSKGTTEDVSGSIERYIVRATEDPWGRVQKRRQSKGDVNAEGSRAILDPFGRVISRKIGRGEMDAAGKSMVNSLSRVQRRIVGKGDANTGYNIIPQSTNISRRPTTIAAKSSAGGSNSSAISHYAVQATTHATLGNTNGYGIWGAGTDARLDSLLRSRVDEGIAMAIRETLGLVSREPTR